MKLRYEQGHIYDTHSKKKYNPKDKADMEILCKEVNDTLLHFEFELDDKKTIINRIKSLLCGDVE
jgi:valyl-tRNA synthetase